MKSDQSLDVTEHAGQAYTFDKITLNATGTNRCQYIIFPIIFLALSDYIYLTKTFPPIFCYEGDKLIFLGEVDGVACEAFCFIEFSASTNDIEMISDIGVFQGSAGQSDSFFEKHHAVVQSESDAFKEIVVQTLKLLS